MICCSIWSRILYPGFNILLRETGTCHTMTQKQANSLKFFLLDDVLMSLFSAFSLNQMDFTNYKSFHIPRASLSSASNSGQSSTDSIRDFDRRQSDATKDHRKQGKVINGPQSMPSSSSSSAASINPKTNRKLIREKEQTKMEKLHRGSKSSQGSSSENNSSNVSSNLASKGQKILSWIFFIHLEYIIVAFECCKLRELYEDAGKLSKIVETWTRVDK